MNNFSSSLDFAQQLDQQDPLCILPRAVCLQRSRSHLPGWQLPRHDAQGCPGKIPPGRGRAMGHGPHPRLEQRLVGCSPTHRRQDRPAHRRGARADMVGDTVSINLFKLATAALTLQPEKTRIITDTFNFPSDLYILQGFIRQTLPGNRHENDLHDRCRRSRYHP